MKSYLVAELEDEGNRHLGSRIGRVSWNVGYHDAVLLAVGNVDYVVACGENADILDVGEAGEHLSIEYGLIRKDDLSPRSPFVNKFRRGNVVDRDVSESV